MKPFTVLVFTGLLLLCACAGNDITTTGTTFNDSTITMADAVTDTDSLMAARYAPVSKRFKASEIIDCPFPTASILGTWTTSLDDPACNFLINAKAFMYCDYDGNGERLYRIVADSIFLDEAESIRKGRILKASGDSLVIRWDSFTDVDATFIRWRN